MFNSIEKRGSLVESPEKSEEERTQEQRELDEYNLGKNMLEQADELFFDLKKKPNKLLKEIDAEVLQDQSISLTPDDLSEAKEAIGLSVKLEAIIQKGQQLIDAFKEKIVDHNIKRTLKRFSCCQELLFGRPELTKLVNSLSPDQLQRHPEIVAGAKRNVVKMLEYECQQYPFETRLKDVREGMSEIFSTFQNHLEIKDDILKSPEVLALQEKILLRYLYSTGSSCLARQMALALNIEEERAKNIAIDAIKKTIAGYNIKSDEHQNYIYDIKQVIADFEISKDIIKDLALSYYQAKAIGGNLWYFNSKSFKEIFYFSDQEFQQFVSDNKLVLIKLAEKSVLHDIQKSSDYRSATGLLRYFAEQLDLDFLPILENFKQLPEISEAVSQAILNTASAGKIAENKNDFESTFNISVDEILRTPEGQIALYKGVQSLIKKGTDSKIIQDFISRFDLSIDNICSNPQTLANLRSVMKKYERNNYYIWRPDLVELLKVKDEDIRDLKILTIVSAIKRGRYQSGFGLIDSMALTEDDEKTISKDVFGSDDKFNYLSTIKRFVENKVLPNIITNFIKDHERFSSKTVAQLEAYIIISQKIIDSPSQEIIRIKDQLIEQILATENPEKTHEIVDNIFIQNNLPLIGKIHRVFDILYPDNTIERYINENSSPVLQGASSRRRRNIIFQDLLKIHIESGNRSLEKFLTLIKESEPLIDKLQQDSLTQTEQDKLNYVLRKLKMLADVSTLGQKNELPPISGQSLLSDYKEIATQLGVNDDQKISERVVDMFARPLGYQNIDQILAEMQRSRAAADQRSRQSLDQLNFRPGDIAKGVDIDYIDNILQNGSVAKEFLGASSSSDATPLDTDVELVTEAQKSTFQDNYQALSHVHKYGELTLVIKDRGQFQKTSIAESAKYNQSKYELFQTLSANHFGIRTGFPCTEVDFMVLKSTDPKTIDNLFYSIAQNGYYIPVVDVAGQLLLTPDIYDEYRKVFTGVEIFNGSDMEFVSLQGDPAYIEAQELVKEKMIDDKRIEELKTEIRQMVLMVLDKFSIKLKGVYDDSLLGAEFLDIGSTGRSTNMIGEGDFDFNLKLDAQDFDKVSSIAASIISMLGSQMKEAAITPSASNNHQLRLFGTNVFSQKDIDIDIGFVKKSDLNVYASHDAIADKLDNIRQKCGEQAYKETVANILLAKQWLKEGSAYKKGDHGDGGLGGIGVENLILAYKGNIRQAFGAFYRAAKNEDGSVKSFASFKQDFKVLDAGMNLRFNNHDNFVLNMNESGYRKMLAVIEEHKMFD